MSDKRRNAAQASPHSARKANYLDSINKRYGSTDKRERGSEKRRKAKNELLGNSQE
jgi:hypothetical protein